MFFAAKTLSIHGNLDEALTYYDFAAKQGFAPALFRLGKMYLDGAGVAQNRELAMRYLEQAARQGHIFAKRELAVDQWHSRGLHRKLTGGWLWFLTLLEGVRTLVKNPHADNLKA